jgi:hypothetical protein
VESGFLKGLEKIEERPNAEIVRGHLGGPVGIISLNPPLLQKGELKGD